MSSSVVECPTCGHRSECIYRCDECGADLAGEDTTHGRQEVTAGAE